MPRQPKTLNKPRIHDISSPGVQFDLRLAASGGPGGGSKRRQEGGFVTSVRRALSGIYGSEAHTSKLQSVFRHAFSTGWATLATKLRPGWMPRSEELAMFGDWDRVYREIRECHLADGVAQPAPADSRELHSANVIPMLRQDHGRRHVVPV